jgi:hypothetical protein
LRDFLSELIQQNRDSQGRPLFYEELLDDMRAAWSDARPMFDRIAARVEDLNEDEIEDHGLDGAQLRFKLSVIRFLHGMYLGTGVRYLRGLIGAIDTLLKSILSAIGAGEGIIEIKEYIEHSLKPVAL